MDRNPQAFLHSESRWWGDLFPWEGCWVSELKFNVGVEASVRVWASWVVDVLVCRPSAPSPLTQLDQWSWTFPPLMTHKFVLVLIGFSVSSPKHPNLFFQNFVHVQLFFGLNICVSFFMIFLSLTVIWPLHLDHVPNISQNTFPHKHGITPGNPSAGSAEIAHACSHQCHASLSKDFKSDFQYGRLVSHFEIAIYGYE